MTIRASAKPVIASINGVAAGGGANLALACDLRIASTEAQARPDVQSDRPAPGLGGTFFLPRLVGPAKALELFWGAEVIGAEECLQLGLFNQVVAPERARRRDRWRSRARSPPSRRSPVAMAKRRCTERSSHTLPEMLDYELDAQLRCFQSGDAREGITAFTEKREPRFAAAPPTKAGR